MFAKSISPILCVVVVSIVPFFCVAQNEDDNNSEVEVIVDANNENVQAVEQKNENQEANQNSIKENSLILDSKNVPEVLSNEDQHRTKQIDTTIDKIIPLLREINDKVTTTTKEYNDSIRNIYDNKLVAQEILSKYKPLIEQILRENSVIAAKEKSIRIGDRTPDMAAKQAQKLQDVLKEIKVILETPENDIEIPRLKVEDILKEISAAMVEQKEEIVPNAENQQEYEEQISKAKSVINDITSEIQKSIIKDQYILNYLEQKREARKKSAWLKAVKNFSDITQEVKKAVSDADSILYPLESENVEHLKTRIIERAMLIRKRVARIVWQYAEKSFSEKRFNDAKDSWELARRMFADISLDIVRAQEKLNIKSQKLAELQKNSEKEVEIIVQKEEKCEKEIAANEFREQVSLENVDSGRSQRLNSIDVNLIQAETLIKNQEYMKARDTLETVLMKDPYNIKATRMLKNLYETIHDAGRVRRYNEYLETLAINEWNWNEAVLPRPADKPVQELITKQADRSSIASKLNDIIISRIEFDDTSLNSAVQFLTTESKNNDTSPERTGVPIMLQINAEQMAQIPRITITLDDMPIGEIIRYICQSTGLKYKVEDKAVIISNEITTVMETRFFKVRASIINSIAPATTEETTTDTTDMLDVSAFGETTTGTTTTPQANVSTEQLKAYFTERGVPFTDQDSSIAYDRRSGKLVVTNTPENLRRIETLLREIDIETPLVLIEAKFVELTQEDLEELGFEYLFSKDPNVTPGNQTDTSSWWQVAQNASTMRTLGNNVSGIPSPVAPTVNSRLINNLQWPANFGPGGNGLGRYNLSFYLHAINRSQAAEVLSAPKVIATSGSEAVIRMIREEFYPETWSEPELTVTDSLFRVTPSIPEFGEATDVGITFRVTPTVSPNNYTITLNIRPQVIERTGWTNYSYDIVVGGSRTTATLIMRELSIREVSTNVKVYDGETLIVGGMIRDNVSAVDDRIPGLGDIPLLGRLARTTNELKTKRNLIIFITARLVNPDGIPIRAGEIRGSFDFRR